jgi:hypothetical protein
MASKSSSASAKDKSLPVIKRTAVDTSGCLGSLYNQYQDQILGKLNVKIKKKALSIPSQNSQCQIIKGNTDENQNIFRMIDIQDDLRLNILLNLVPWTGLTALSEYSSPINESSRILRFTYVNREERLPDYAKNIRQHIKPSMLHPDATHFIIGVTWGFDVLVILQLSPEAELVRTADKELEKIQQAFQGNHSSVILDTHSLNISNMKVYSNISFLTKATSLDDIYQKVHQLKKNHVCHRPIEYTLCSIQEIYSKNNDMQKRIASLDASFNSEIEQHFLQMSTSIKYLESYYNENKPSVLRQYFAGQLYDMCMQLSDVKKKYINELDRFAKLVIDFRKGSIEKIHIQEALNDDQQKTLKKNIAELTENKNNLEAKPQLITELQKQQFQYWNVAEHSLDGRNNLQTVEQKLIKDDQLDRILCSNDTLNKDKLLEFNQLRDQLVQQHQSNPELRLFYADFPNYSNELTDIIILPRDKVNHTEGASNHITFQQPMKPPISAATPSDDAINILLLGESGVGKSTFINAFVNYLKFGTLKEAESQQPVVLIPVSFLITFGNNFEERLIKFGYLDGTNNEDFDHPGQSVTQRCKSYLFNLNRIDNRKLRIIDTPGFGDTRGLDQDDLNMQHILEYINNLTHLDAVCFLLKPNVMRLNNYFRTCVTQLLDLLGPNARQNIIFCFTNSRCTFYTPGDTAPPLRALLDSLQKEHIPFTKTNTFSFDSESFRYLVALQNSVHFSEVDRNEYEQSWSKSATESNRLIDYICSKPTAFNIHNKWKSIRHAQMEIVHMTLPVLEAMRNTLRNVVLIRMKSQNTSIKLISKGVDLPNTVCLSCELNLRQTAGFWITVNNLHTDLNKCFICKCAPDQHISIDYTLGYEVSENLTNDDENEMTDQISLLLNASVALTCFLKNTAYFSKFNLFLLGLDRMIREEQQICAQKKESNQFNLELLKELEKLKDKYVRCMDEMKSNKNSIDLPVIYERIAITRNYPGVQEQMNAVKQGQQNMMKYYEYEVPNSLTDTPNIVSTDF